MASQGRKVVVRGLTTAVASKPVQPGTDTYPLSVLDHLLAYHGLRLVFYYGASTIPATASAAGGMGQARLRESLAEVLTLYPVVTGRLRRDVAGNWDVKCSDTGVRLRLAAVEGASVEEWVESATAEEEKELARWEEVPEEPSYWSPYNVQINEFERGGIAIGLGLTHMHADPICATLLVKSWAEQNRRAAIGHPPFCLVPALRGRASPNTKTESVQFYEAKSKKVQPTPGSAKMLTATFRFPESTVEALLSEIHPHCPEATPFDALAALFWWRAATNRLDKVVANEHSLTVCMDFRKLMHAPLPHGFYGNAIHFTKVSVDGTHMEAGGLDQLAAAIRSHLSRVPEEEYWSVIDWVESRRDPQGKFPPPFQMYGPELTAVNLEHLFAYSATFVGDRRPLHFSCRVEKAEGEGLILVLPSPEEGLGRTVTVTLPEEQLAKICQDEAVLRPGVTLVMSDKR